MARAAWNTIKKSKSFYVTAYRKTMRLVIYSLLLNLLLGGLIIYSYFHRPEQIFYASDGIVEPVQLVPLSEPNYSAQALLPPDPVNDEQVKMIPQ